MSKELEALERLWNETKGNPNTSSMSNRSDRDCIIQALQAPSSEDVCKALEDMFGGHYTVTYKNKQFFRTSNSQMYPKVQKQRILYLINDHVIKYDINVKPKVSILLGRFYESESGSNE